MFDYFPGRTGEGCSLCGAGRGMQISRQNARKTFTAWSKILPFHCKSMAEVNWYCSN